jgi:hypothetical protein
VFTGIAWRIRKHGHQHRRQRVQKAPPLHRRRPEIEIDVQRGRLPHHAHAGRTDGIEIGTHPEVPVAGELEWDLIRRVVRVDARGDQRDAVRLRRLFQERDDFFQSSQSAGSRRVRRDTGLELSTGFERDSGSIGQREDRRALVGS